MTLPSPLKLAGAAAVVATAVISLAFAAPSQGAFPSTSSRIVFSAVKVGDPYDMEIYSMNPDGSGKKKLTTTTSPYSVSEPSISADGQKIAYVSNEPNGNNESQIWVMNADGSNPKQLTFISGQFGVKQPTFSPNGKTVAFTVGHPLFNRDVWTIGIDGKNAKNLTHSASIDDADPEFSPDGTRIAYSRDGQIHLMNPDGTNDKAFTMGSLAADQHPSWSPDGKLLAFSRNTGQQGRVIATAKTTGGPVTYLTEDHDDTFPAFSPSGTQIAFRRDTDHLFRMTSAGANETPYIPAPLDFQFSFFGWGDWGPGGLILGG